MYRVRAVASGAALSLLAAVLGASGAAQAGAGPQLAPPLADLVSDVEHFAEAAHYPLAPGTGAVLAAWKQTPAGAAQFARPATGTAGTPAEGTRRLWLSLDDVADQVYLKEYTLRGVGTGIEVWVASGLGPGGVIGTDFPATDCRKVIANSTTVTDAQVRSLVRAYDTTMLPKLSKAFSVAPERDGARSEQSGFTAGMDFSGDGDKVVTLVDNIRDPNFYDFPTNQTYIAGFFSRQFNELTDRNVMTIDAFDWAHRTGANPTDEPTTDLCSSRPARPQLYEGIFAHEYQHLLQYYTDPAEVTFLNEGLSDYALTVTGYGEPERSVFQRGFESHIVCFQGFGTVTTRFNPNARECGGPQNSLTLWGDEGPGAQILADYGVVWAFLLFLRDRYGDPMVESIHRDGKRRGLAGIASALRKVDPGAKLTDVLHDFQVMLLLDKAVGGEGGRVTGIARSRVISPSLNSELNLDNPAAYAAPGVAPNGADYVPLRGSGTGFLAGADLTALRFDGQRTLAPIPVPWSVAPRIPLTPPSLTPGAQVPAGALDNPALFSGNTSRLDSTAVFAATVPLDNPMFSFLSLHHLEAGADYGYTVVSTDGGASFSSLSNAATTRVRAPAPAGNALTGTSVVPVPMTFDLTAFAGKKVLLGFRHVSDAAVNEGGWYIDDVRLGDRLISDGSSLDGLRPYSAASAVKVRPWTITIVGLDSENRRAHVIPFTGTYAARLGPAQLRALKSYPRLVAVISHDDPSESLLTYAQYALTVNGLTQLGGRG
ncbi:MAG: peptidase M6 immune inhibitor A [Sporichthyaceae bacterium]